MNREYEEKISKFDGDDVLELWIEYIQWIQNAYPSLGPESDFVPVLERCTRSLMSEEKYKDDPRYLDIWLKYVSRLPFQKVNEWFRRTCVQIH